MTDPKQVIRALFDSYLASRASTKWNQKEFDPGSLAKNSAEYGKVIMIKELAEKIPDDQYLFSPDEWLNYVYLLADKGAIETQNKEDNRSRPFSTGLAKLFVGPESRAENTCHAARAYILAILNANETNKRHIETVKNGLTDDIIHAEKELEETKKILNADKTKIEELKNKITSLTNKRTAIIDGAAEKFHETYYNKYIKSRDPRKDEVTFDDFCKNAQDKNGLRYKTPFLDKAEKLNSSSTANKDNKAEPLSPLATGSTFKPKSPQLPPRTTRSKASGKTTDRTLYYYK